MSFSLMSVSSPVNPSGRPKTYFPPNAPKGVRLEDTTKESTRGIWDARRTVVVLILFLFVSCLLVLRVGDSVQVDL